MGNNYIDEKKVEVSLDLMIDTLKVLKHYTTILGESYSSLFGCLCETYDELIEKLSQDKVPETIVPLPLDEGIESLELSFRTYNALTKAGICRISDILNFPKSDFIKIRTIGKCSIREIENRMHENGYKDFIIEYRPPKKHQRS